MAIAQWVKDKAAAFRVDSWQSALTGLGTGRDKLSSYVFGGTGRVHEQTLENLYTGDDVAARIVETLPQDALRQGVSLQIQPSEDEGGVTPEDAAEVASATLKYLEELEAWSRIQEAAIWGRLFGGAAIWMVVDDGADVATPLREETVRGIRNLVVVDRRDLQPQALVSDPMDPHFGRPESYLLIFSSGNQAQSAMGSQVVHASRLIIFEGEITTRRRRNENDSWADSVLTRVRNVLRDFNVSFASVAHLLQDNAQAVFKMKDLVGMLAEKGNQRLQERMELVDMARSVTKALLIDMDESFERTATPMTGTPEALEKITLRLASAARMPVTKLMGQSPAGMNATGESDRATWEDEVAAYQEQHLRPQVKRLIELVFFSDDGPTQGNVPEDWAISFNPLRQLTDLELAQLRNTQAQTDAIYIQNGVTLSEEIGLSRFGPSGYSTDTQIDLEARKLVLEQDPLDPENQPEPPPAPPTDEGEDEGEGDE